MEVVSGRENRISMTRGKSALSRGRSAADEWENSVMMALSIL